MSTTQHRPRQAAIRFVKKLMPLALACLLYPLPLAAEPVRVAVSIKPVHSLIAGVMAGAGEPALLVRGAASPHDYVLRPSDAKAIRRAALVVWTGAGMEPFLEKPLRVLAGDARVIELLEIDGMALAPFATAGGVNPHLWLDPENAAVLVAFAASALTEIDPGNASRYRRNAARMQDRLSALDRRLRSRLAPLSAKPFAVYHDAYAYLARRYRLNSVGALTLNPERPPGARRLHEFRKLIEGEGVRCFFMEPDTPAGAVPGMIAEAGVRSRVLDPVGYNLEPGPGLYFSLMEALSATIASCLAEDG